MELLCRNRAYRTRPVLELRAEYYLISVLTLYYRVVASRYILYTLYTLCLTYEGGITLYLEFPFWKLPLLIISAFKGINFQKRLFTPLKAVS